MSLEPIAFWVLAVVLLASALAVVLTRNLFHSVLYLALLAKHTSRPVRLVYTREESFLAHAKRHPYIITHRTGVKKDGTITASRIEQISDSGAYPYLSPYVLLYSAVMAPGPYRIDNLLVDTYSVATNNPYTSAFRGFGGPQACFAYEGQMDSIAEALGLDPLEVRRVNYVHAGDSTSTGQVSSRESLPLPE